MQKKWKKNQKSDFFAIYPGHKSEILGGKKSQKKRPVLGTPDKSKIKKKNFDLSGVLNTGSSGNILIKELLLSPHKKSPFQHKKKL